MESEIYYRHSGKFSLPGTAVSLVVSAVAGALLAFVYSYVILYIPLVGYVTFLLSGGFGALVGIVTARALKWGKVRNTWVALAVTAATALLAWDISWAVWIYAAFRQAEVDVSLVEIFLQPGVLWEVIQEVNKEGAWTIGSGFSPTGLALWIFWGIEALLILGAAFYFAWDRSRDEVFCEGCNSWCEVKALVRVGEGDGGELKKRIEAKDLGFLEKRGAIQPGASAWFQLDLRSCPACGLTNTLTVNSVILKVEEEKETPEIVEAVLDKLLLTSVEAETICRLGERLVKSAATPSSLQS